MKACSMGRRAYPWDCCPSKTQETRLQEKSARMTWLRDFSLEFLFSSSLLSSLWFVFPSCFMIICVYLNPRGSLGFYLLFLANSSSWSVMILWESWWTCWRSPTAPSTLSSIASCHHSLESPWRKSLLKNSKDWGLLENQFQLGFNWMITSYILFS